MKRRIPFALKLGLSFAIAILSSVALVYFLTARSITKRFDEYRQHNTQQVAEQVCDQLAWYRDYFGTWVGVDRLLLRRVTIQIGETVIEGRTSLIKGRYSLANEEGKVFITTEGTNMGKVLTPDELRAGIPISVDGERVGTLLLGDVGPNLDPSEREFLLSVKQSALLGGGIATGVASLLSILLISQVLSPLRVLTRATERIAHGDLPNKIRFRARDEFGQLSQSFNHMVENLRRSESVRRTMTADIAHELRTPVTIIQGTLEAILDGIYEPTDDTIAPIYEETLHLGRLIDDLRDLAMAEAGELSLERESTDIDALIRQVAETAVSAVEHAPDLRIRTDPDLPPVSADPKRLRQVLVNLLSNALRYTPATGTIAIDARLADDDVEIRVTDTGPGISEDDLPHLFERFYRGDPARNREGGTGLGLAIVKQWVEAHGGRIWAENAPAGGARFTFRIPIA